MIDDSATVGDLVLLGRYSRTRDAEAFAELVRRYAGLVYGTCLRVLGNVHDANDVTQECFLEMARKSVTIQSSLGGWLHALATSRSRNAIRNARTRRDYEMKTALEPDSGPDPAWTALEPLVDQSLESLPDDLRIPLVLHFLRGLNQQQVATELGVSQATVSRRLEAGVARLRRSLSQTGVVVSVSVLASLLTAHTATAVPASIMAGLGKLALAGVAQETTVATAAATTTGVSASAKVLACAAGVGLLGAAGYAIVRPRTAPEPVPPPVVAPAAPRATNEATSVTNQPGLSPVLMIGNGRMAIPRFPRLIERVDDAGQVVTTEKEPPWHDHIVGCLHVAMGMIGHDLPWPLVFAASGHPWRFAFERGWAHDVEHITPVDELAAACERLGFEYTALYDRPWPEVRDAITAALAAGRPVLAGLDARFWCIIVGQDPATGEYLTIGGAPYRHWKPHRAKAGAAVPDTLTPDECLRRPIPADGFIGAVLAPSQFARNPVFILGPRNAMDESVAIRRTIEQGIALMAPGTIERWALDLRRAYGPSGEVATMPRAGTFQTGNDGIRAWAAALETRAAPSHDFGFIHAIDTSLGMQLRGAVIAADFLDWAAAKSGAATRARLLAAAQRLRRTLDDPALLYGYNDYLPDTLDPAVLARTLVDEPRLSYIATPAQREALEGLGYSVRRCPWGLSVLPDQAAFEIARARAAERLMMLADARDEAARDLIAALDEETQETRMIEPIQMTPPISQNGNIYARGMAAILDHLGGDLSYEDILGLTGVAFILQVDTSGPFSPEGNIDAAWWPNDPWGFHLGLPVLSRAAGWDLRALRIDVETYRADPEAVFRRVFAGPIEQSLRAGKPALAYGFVITGMDDQPQPLSGYGTSGKSTRYSQETMRLKWQPWDLCVVGERLPVSRREDVDGLSLRHIVTLFNEQAQDANAAPTRFSGRRAWAEWLKMLYEGRDQGGTSKFRSAWDNNVLIHLRYNRAAAVAYLRAMAGRHPGRIAERLTIAADLYQRALDELNRGELPHPGPTRGGLPAYIAMAEHVLQLEIAAMALLDDAAGQLEGAALVEGRVIRASGGTTDAPADDERLVFKGNGMVDDAVSLALQAAGRLFDVPADYDTLASLTVNAFAPAINRGEDCLSHWMVEGCLADQNIPLAARHLGLKAERLLLPPFAGDNGNDDDLRRYHRGAAPLVVGALRDGAVVLTTGGWDIRGPKGFVHWGLAGLVTEADLDGMMAGAHLWGARKHPVKYPAAMWALRAEGDPRPAADLAVEAMRQGVDRIRGQGRYVPTGMFVYGLAAMDAWIERMGNTPGYCGPCFGRSGKAGDAANNAQRVSNLSKTAARFLRSQGERYEPAARHYDRIVELLAPVLTGQESERYAAFLGDMDKQRAHVAAVLAPVRAEFAAAAEALAAVLP